MDEPQLRRLLEAVADGALDTAAALEQLRRWPITQVGGFAHIDTHRDLRTGFPEVVYCAGKTDDQIVAIVQAMLERQRCVLATRMSAATAARLSAEGLPGEYLATARCWVVPAAEPRSAGLVAVVCAGTSDLPVAEEAAVTASTMGSRVERIYDVGVAGLHRLLGYAEALQQAHAVVVVAGMEGALPSVVGGLVACPVIAVPTSVGYGAHFGGLAPLLAMLNSCASGVSVVNIDNGFGGGYCAHQINWQVAQAKGAA
ncbi:MAG: nickel pincer cofactor biosynthesis protein LarB [Fimbriimonadaceae bacterium]|nr:nickel pincer cofactor biosynthesis protein LarB [Fimbriimonadaceae bacterium]